MFYPPKFLLPLISLAVFWSFKPCFFCNSPRAGAPRSDFLANDLESAARQSARGVTGDSVVASLAARDDLTWIHRPKAGGGFQNLETNS